MKYIYCCLFLLMSNAALASNAAYQSLVSEVSQLYAKGEYHSAIIPATKLLANIAATSGKNNMDYAKALDSLASLYRRIGEYETSLPLYQESLVIRGNIAGKHVPDYAIALNALASLYRTMGEYHKALVLYKKALNTRLKTVGKTHPDYAQSLNSLGRLYREMGEYNKAKQSLSEALKIRKDALGEHSVYYAYTLSNLASLYRVMGQYDKALPLYKQALGIKKDVLGEHHPSYAKTLSGMGYLYEALGDYAKALAYDQQALKIREQVFGDKHPAYAKSLLGLSHLYRVMGDYKQALPLYQKMIGIRKNKLGESHPLYALSLSSLASLYRSMGEYEKAVPLYEKALQIEQEIVGKKHPAYAKTLSGLAQLYRSTKQYEKALILYQEARAIRKETLGELHPDYVVTISSIANLYRMMGRYDAILPLLEQGLNARRRSLGETHPDYALSLNNLAFYYAESGENLSQALKYFLQAQRLLTQHIERNFAVMTEKQKLLFVASNEAAYFATLSLVQAHFPKDEKAVSEALNLVLSRKSMVFDAQALQNQVLTESVSPKNQEIWLELLEERRWLSSLLQRKPKQMNYQDYRGYIKKQQTKVAKLEAKVSAKSAVLSNEIEKRHITPNMLKLSIEDAETLIEFVKIRDYDWKQGAASDAWRYLAFVLKKKGAVQLIDLGRASALDEKIQEALKSIARIGTDAISQQQASESLYQQIWQPLVSAVGQSKLVFVSPDGLLNLVPFNAMRNDKGKYLVESVQIVYLTSGRALLKEKIQLQPQAEQALYLAANPEFNWLAKPKPRETMGSHSVDSSLFFPQLPGTELEAQVIPALLSGKHTVVTGKEATEYSLLHAKSSKVIHLATHGFFLQSKPMHTAANTRGAIAMMDDDDTPQATKLPKGYENPMVRSGLALAGANHAKDAKNGDDGLLTALEVSGMNLHATDLVTLSACETGRGEVKTGDGVYGLRRAFALAGAKNLVMSLWPVSDAITATQMQQFYQAYGKGKSPATAMRLAQLNTIKDLRNKKGFAAPALWAPFMVQGASSGE